MSTAIIKEKTLMQNFIELRLRELVLFIAACLTLFAAPVMADVANGKRLWDDNCAGCHGVKPSGRQVAVGSTLAGLRRAINSIGAMTPFRGWTDAQVSDVSSYIRGDPLPNVVIKPEQNWTDIWYNEAESGWGLNITQHANTDAAAGQIFAVLYAYEINGNPIWYTVSGGTWLSPTVFTGKVYRTKGPAANVNPFNKALVGVQEAGTLTLTFSSRDAAQLNYTIEGRAVNKMITRLKF